MLRFVAVPSQHYAHKSYFHEFGFRIAGAVSTQMTDHKGEVHFWMGGSTPGPGAQCSFLGKQGNCSQKVKGTVS
jgi:hypothetical protein